MQKLTDNEIRFIKDTGVTPAVIQNDEWDRTRCKNFDDAATLAKTAYNIDLDALYKKTTVDTDFIALDFAATYLLYTFFTKEELMEMSPVCAVEWLQDFKYWYDGYRKWSTYDAALELQEAIEIYNGTRQFYDMEGNIWNGPIDEEEYY